MSQIALWPTYTVHCFFGRCQFLVRRSTPTEAHDEMEKHYQRSHAEDIARLLSTGKR